MITKLLSGLLVLLALAPPASAQEQNVSIAFIDRAGDPFYAPSEGYGGIYRVDRGSVIAGAELAIKDAKILERAENVKFTLVHRTLEAGETVEASLLELAKSGAPVAAILDLPLDEVEAASHGASLPLFNIRHRDVGLRQRTCNTRLFHTIPSDAMLQDGLVQYLRAANYNDVLVIEGDSPADQAISKAFQASAKKFGLDVAEVRQFVHGNDPRQRDLNNPRLLTGGADYGVVFVADASREFGRYLPYETYLPRPVVGTAGLVPHAWHPLWERHGGPQLSRRFYRLAKRDMTDEDWAAWAAVRSVIEAWIRKGDSLEASLLAPDLELELYKAYAGSFRPWNHQLRQGILLATEEAVIGLAPVEGALHQFDVLDTLGQDEPEFVCNH